MMMMMMMIEEGEGGGGGIEEEEEEEEEDSGNNRGYWNHLKITHTVPEHEIKNYKKKNSHIGWHCTHTSRSTNVKVQNIFNTRNNITCSKVANTEQLQHYIP